MKPLRIAASLAALAAVLAACGSQAPTNAALPEAASPNSAQPEPVAGPAAEPSRMTFTQACDGSAAIALSGNRIAVAHDDDNELRIYDVAGGTWKWKGTFLGGGDDEADIEGAARIGDIIYWIASHGTDGDGEPAPKRRAFFATRIVGGELVRVGETYGGLVEALDKAESTKKLGLAAAAAIEAEDPNSLNIEALAPTPDGRLLIGLRSPQPGGNALVVELINPSQVIEGGTPQIGAALPLALGENMGVRSLDWSPREQAYLVIAGPFGADGPHALFRWEGGDSKPQPWGPALPSGFKLEALSSLDDGSLLLLSDDGDVKTDGIKCKKAEVGKRSFRGMIFRAGG